MKNMIVIQGSGSSQHVALDSTGRRPKNCLNDIVFRVVKQKQQYKLYPISRENFDLLDFEVGIIRL